MEDLVLIDYIIKKNAGYIEIWEETPCKKVMKAVIGCEDGIKIKDWLEEALKKPRYEVTSYCMEVMVKDNVNNQIMATFWKDSVFDARREAEKFCTKLNQENCE
jgi:hypothetical protein